ncbi:MAG: T9SS type A sorting domain-containing protein [Saprospiraceae bacterium]|nr:discoidin domain-containing protein [Bacteroidia bacterium]NNE14659.1 T9SS type A sorting domain-containing protein [Saprospiraceae bacterium]NNL91312.1 T9SS type A sorting domain-containing protein [Saprospiraceae bacterium]
MKNKYIILTLFIACLGLNMQAQCLDESHSPFKDQGWMSCTESQSPNTIRGNSHWIMYDLGYKYLVDSIKVWNHNVWGETGNGARWIIVDYSIDGSNWEPAGTFRIGKAPGSWKYESDEILDLNHAFGRYFLVTVLEAHDENANCVGVAEVKFNLGIMSDTEEEILADTWTIAPNPAVDVLNIDLGNQSQVDQLIITNSIGQIVTNIKPTRNLLNLDVSEFISGMYYVTIIKEGERENKTFVKMSTR